MNKREAKIIALDFAVAMLEENQYDAYVIGATETDSDAGKVSKEIVELQRQMLLKRNKLEGNTYEFRD
jgi:phosphotransacetylase